MSADAIPLRRPLKVLLVDDEAPACLRLRTLLADCLDPPTEVVGEACDVPSALSFLSQDNIDLVLLDVAMPGMDGTQLAAELALRSRPPAVVFVTAHAQHAVQAFDLSAVDYLTKPVRAERLQSALLKVQNRLSSWGSVPTSDPTLIVTERGRVRRIPISHVLYFKAELKYVTLRTAQHAYVMDESLSELTQRLGVGFIRIHRNALVARHAIRELERRVMSNSEDDVPTEQWAVRIAAVDEWLAVSRRHVGQVRETLSADGI